MKVARKSFASWFDFKREIRVLNLLRSSLSRNERILYSLAVIEVGDKYNVLAPVAKTDLEQFLAGEYGHTSDLTLKNLLGEARKLMGGLDFLHGKLQTDPPGLSCCHNDLKPANILVFFEEGSSLVGTWKISDFGISIIGQPDEPRMLTTDGEAADATKIPTFHHEPARNPGTYQAPEVCYDGNTIGRKSDIWSMGCILVRIFMLAIGGPSALEKLDWKRGQPDEDGVDCGHDYFHRGSPGDSYLNPHIEQWIKELPARSATDQDPPFWNKIKSLLLWMLSIDRRDRPSAQDVVKELYEIEELVPHDLITPPPQPSSLRSTCSRPSDNPSLPPTSTSITSEGSQSILVKWVVEAIESGQPASLLSSLRTGVDIEEPYKGRRPLLYAIKHGNLPAVQTLLDYKQGLDLKTPDLKGRVPLAIAARLGDADMINLLVSAGALVDQRSAAGKTALMEATWCGHYHAVVTLLEHGADFHLCSDDQWTVLHHAVHGSGGDQLISLFIDHLKFDVDTPTEQDNETPLIMLIKNYQDSSRWWDKFRALLRANADVNMADREGNSPLSIAVENGFYPPAWCLKNEYGAVLGTSDISFNQLSPKMSKLLNRRSSVSRVFSSFRKH